MGIWIQFQFLDSQSNELSRPATAAALQHSVSGMEVEVLGFHN